MHTLWCDNPFFSGINLIVTAATIVAVAVIFVDTVAVAVTIEDTKSTTVAS